MLRRFSELRGCTLGATDGELGKLVDLYFDDVAWAVRYLVVDIGRWLPGRQVLISPAAAGELDAAAHLLPVGLSMEQVRNSPELDAALPVSRQREDELVRYYGWPMYWMPEAAGWAPSVPPVGAAEPSAGAVPRPAGPAVAEGPESSLRSAREVIGERIHARDGDIGHLHNLVIDDWEWMVRYLVVDTRSFWAGKMVLVPPHAVREVNWEEARVSVDLDRETIRNAPAYDPHGAIHRNYEEHLHEYYGWTRYWAE